VTEPVIRDLGNKLLYRLGRTRSIELCKANKWKKVLAYIETKEK